MKKLARKLSVFALSSVMLLSNSPIKAGMFAEGQTYDLGEVGTVNIRNHYINNDGSVEAFDVHIENLKLDIDVYRENDGIAYVLRNAGNVVSSDTIEHCEYFRNAEYVLNILIERITGTNLPTFPRLIPSTPECSMTTIETSISENNNKHVADKKPKKVNQPGYRKITYNLPKGYRYDYQHGHCACEQPIRFKDRAILEAKIEGKHVRLDFYHCLKCLKPIRQSRETSRTCCWKTYCKECSHETEFYMKRGTGDQCVLICCRAYPFEIHEIEYANTAEFNDAVDREQIKHICSKNPNHIRGHARKTDVTRGAICLDCMKAYNVTYHRKNTK